MEEFLEDLIIFFQQLRYSSFNIRFSVFFIKQQNKEKHILCQILIHRQIKFHDEEFFLLELLLFHVHLLYHINLLTNFQFICLH